MINEQEVAKRFISAVNAYIVAQNAKMRRYGLTEFIPVVDDLPEADEELLLRFSKHSFPELTPHRHLYFFDEYKQNAEYVAFGGNDNYNDIYVVNKQTGKVLAFSEEEEFRYECADSFAAFLAAFTLLINLEITLSKSQRIVNPLLALDEVVAAAGGEEYRAFYREIFPISIERMLN